jgi:predicted Zn-dependent protease with MMP-like domain
MSAPRDDALPDGDGPALVEAEEATSGADLYAVLGVTPAATDDEIRRAFRTQAKRWHPDRFAAGPPERRERAERRIRAVIAAYAVLNSPLRRAAYDRAHGYQFARPPMPVGGYVRRSSTRSAEQMRAATGNPNGAGQLAGILCVILAIALLGRSLTQPSGAAWSSLALFVVSACLFALAAVCFSDNSPLARAANAHMEGTPHVPAAHAHPIRDADEQAAPEANADDAAFEGYVEEALESVPEEFRARMANVVVQVEEEPSDEDLQRASVPAGATLLGLYHGVPLTLQGVHGAGPEYVSIYRGPIERHCHYDPDAIREQVRATVLHELAHHFGIDHDDMPEWVK